MLFLDVVLCSSDFFCRAERGALLPLLLLELQPGTRSVGCRCFCFFVSFGPGAAEIAVLVRRTLARDVRLMFASSEALAEGDRTPNNFLFPPFNSSLPYKQSGTIVQPASVTTMDVFDGKRPTLVFNPPLCSCSISANHGVTRALCWTHTRKRMGKGKESELTHP